MLHEVRQQQIEKACKIAIHTDASNKAKWEKGI